jgi:hypothetical protein
VACVTTLPNFFVVGVPKAGTTSLYHYLSQHPQIYMSPIKEPTYFAQTSFALRISARKCVAAKDAHARLYGNTGASP